MDWCSLMSSDLKATQSTVVSELYAGELLC